MVSRGTKRTTIELAEQWHATDCAIDAGGGCVLDLDIKEAWVAGYETASAENERLLSALKSHHDLELWSLGHEVCPECHEPLGQPKEAESL